MRHRAPRVAIASAHDWHDALDPSVDWVVTPGPDSGQPTSAQTAHAREASGE
jgi:hypothetical protein